MRRRVLIAALAAAGAAGAPAAHASTARVAPGGGAVDYVAAGGEQNSLEASATGAIVTLTDTGATITPGAGCAPSGTQRVACTVAGGNPRLSVALGDLDDTATVAGALPAQLDGGPGADTLNGGDAADVL
ncbi:MAG: hypothetical protein QOD73_2096, partial [Solirubrobacteraceae bacterium]|nr:hypothetical protein [Solirubrobacteraceae bacterium]